MIWWLLGLLAGGALLLSNEGSNNSIFMLADLNTPIFKLADITEDQANLIREGMKSKGYLWRSGYEKFRDPRIPRCFGIAGGKNPYAVQGNYTGWFQNGLAEDYLNWPVVGDALTYIGEVLPEADYRINALKAKVKNLADSQSKSLVGLTQVSDNSLEKSITTLYTQIKDKKNWPSLADKAGIPVSSFLEGEAEFEKRINNWTRANLHIDVMSVFNGLKDDLSKLLNSFVKDISKEFSDTVSSAGSALSSSWPIVAQFVEVVEKAKSACESNKRDNTTRFFQAMQKPLQVLVEKGLPFPWHIHEIWPGVDNPSLTCGYFEGGKWLPNLDMQGAYQDYLHACIMLTNLGIAEKSYITKWWADAQVLMADPLVYSIFNAMGRNRGLFASDEQVLVVAAPIAVMNGLDPYSFAKLLWGFDEGWANPAVKEFAWQITKEKFEAKEECYDVGGGDGVMAEGGGTICKTPGNIYYKYSFPGTKENLVVNFKPCYYDTPANAWALNFASLAKTAYDLVEVLKDKGIGLNTVKKAPEFFIPLTVKL